MTSSLTPFSLFQKLSVLALCVLFLSACDPNSPTRQQPGLILGSCDEAQLQARPAWRRAQCGSLAVPENPDQPEGRQISLRVVRLPAVASSPQPDPLFIITGGPGQAATDLLDQLPPLFRNVNRERDVVFVDQRGTGASNPLNCSPEGDSDFSLPPRESAILEQERLRECLAGYDADLRFYTTPFAMDDLNRVREALGYGQINLWGGSYGTRAALVFMRRHPQAVRTAVLDSVAPTDIQLPYHGLADADAALRKLFEHCAAQPACQQAFGDLESRTRQLIANLDREPRQLEVEHPLTRASVPVTISGQLLGGLIRLAMYQRDLGPILPLAIVAAEDDDFRPFTLLLMLTAEVADSMSLGMQHTVLCAEDVMRPAPNNAASEKSILQLDLLSQMRANCEFWPRGFLPEGYFEPVRSELPTLLVSGELDPVTPPRWGELAAQTLPNSLHLVVPGAHHIASHVGCVEEVVEDFIQSASLSGLATECVAEIGVLEPFISPAGPAMQSSPSKKAGEGSADD